MREEFQKQISCIPEEQIFYIDESGFDINMKREYGYSKKGTRIIAEKTGNKHKYKRISVIAELINRKTLIAPCYFNCYTDTVVFTTWIKKALLPFLKQGQTVVMDNAAFHKNKDTKALIESIGCKLLYLPPYSPDLNPIEKKLAHVKRFVKKIKNKFEHFPDALEYALTRQEI